MDKSKVTKTLLLNIRNNRFKILYFSFLHNFSYCSVAHISLILSLRIVSMETTKKSTFKVLFYLKKNAPKKKRKSYGYVQDYRKRQTVCIQYQAGYFRIELGFEVRQGFRQKQGSPGCERQT